MPADLWDKGIPLALLCIAIAKVWLTWRDDMKNASAERTANRESLDKLTQSFDKLTDKLDSFFLSHFP